MNTIIISFLFTFIIAIISIYISLKKDDYQILETNLQKKICITEILLSTILIFLLTPFSIITKLSTSFIFTLIILTCNNSIINNKFIAFENAPLNLLKSIIFLIIAIFPETLQNPLIDFNTMKIIITIISFTIIANYIASILHEISYYFDFSIFFPHITSTISIFSIIILNTNITTSIAFITSLTINVIIYIITKFIQKKIKIK